MTDSPLTAKQQIDELIAKAGAQENAGVFSFTCGTYSIRYLHVSRDGEDKWCIAMTSEDSPKSHRAFTDSGYNFPAMEVIFLETNGDLVAESAKIWAAVNLEEGGLVSGDVSDSESIARVAKTLFNSLNEAHGVAFPMQGPRRPLRDLVSEALDAAGRNDFKP